MMEEVVCIWVGFLVLVVRDYFLEGWVWGVWECYWDYWSVRRKGYVCEVEVLKVVSVIWGEGGFWLRRREDIGT